MIGKQFKRRGDKKLVMVIGDLRLASEGKGMNYVLLCSDGHKRLPNGRYLNDDVNHPWDLVLV
jgi:hypothetical protein